MQDKKKDCIAKLFNKFKYTLLLKMLRGEKFLPGSDDKLTEQPLPCSVATRCTDSVKNQTLSPYHSVLGDH